MTARLPLIFMDNDRNKLGEEIFQLHAAPAVHFDASKDEENEMEYTMRKL